MLLMPNSLVPMAAMATPLSKPSSPILQHLHRRTQSPYSSSRSRVFAAAKPVSDTETREREKLKQMFAEARKRCLLDPMDGVTFTVDDFHAALNHSKAQSSSDVGAKVRGTIATTDFDGAYVDIAAKSSGFLPLQEACIHKIKHVIEAGLCPGLQEEFVIIGQNAEDDSTILSLRSIQNDLAWERCQQLKDEDVVVNGKVCGENKGGLVVIVESLQGFVPFKHISKKSTTKLLNKELPLKFLEVDKEQNQLILSNRKAVGNGQAELVIGSVVLGCVQSIMPYDAFIDMGCFIGFLHISQISHEHVPDIAEVLQPGDSLKVMIMSHDRETDRVTLTTKRLEPTPGDMIYNPKLVFEKAEEMAESFRQRISQVEEMARAMALESQTESGLNIS